jgi:GntR family galactonate operon transcriptional repressor
MTERAPLRRRPTAGYVGRGIHREITESLAKRVLSGKLFQGEVIDVDALMEEWGVSRTVLREALKVLGAKGMVDARPKRGTFVRPRESWTLLDPDVLRWQAEGEPDPVLLSNLQELREMVEPGAARLAAARATPKDIAGLREALRDMAEGSGGWASTVSADVAFHERLLAASHNELLQRLEVVLASGLVIRDRLVHSHGAEDPVPSHEAVLSAIEDGDAAAAEAAMHALLAKARLSVEVLAGDGHP